MALRPTRRARTRSRKEEKLHPRRKRKLLSQRRPRKRTNLSPRARMPVVRRERKRKPLQKPKLLPRRV